MLKEHLKKHFKKIQTIKLKRHHYILGGFGIAAITILASIIGFQNINTHAIDDPQGSVQCSLTQSKTNLTVGERGMASIHCISTIGELPEASELIANEILEYSGSLLSGVMYDFPIAGQEQCVEELCQGDRGGADEITYKIKYIGLSSGTTEFNLKPNVILGKNNGITGSEITITEKDTTQPNCRFSLDETNLVKGFSATGSITCTGANSGFDLSIEFLSYDTGVLEVTNIGTPNELQEITDQKENIIPDRGTINFTLTFRYTGTGEGTTTIQITGADNLGIDNVESDQITVIEPNCYWIKPVTGTHISIGKTGTAIFACLNMSGEIKDSNISYDTGVLEITSFSTGEINSNSQQIEAEEENPQRGNIGTKYTIIYQGTGEGTTRFTINKDDMGIINLQSEEINVHQKISRNVEVLCEWPDTINVEIDEPKTIIVSCNKKDLPDFNLREITEIRTIQGNSPIIETGTAIKDAENQEENSTKYILSFTGNNTGNIELTTTGTKTIESTTYVFDTQKTGYINVQVSLIKCNIEVQDRFIKKGNTGTATVECPGTELRGQLESGHFNYDEEIIEIENITQPIINNGENTIYTITYKGKQTGYSQLKLNQSSIGNGSQQNKESEGDYIHVTENYQFECTRGEPSKTGLYVGETGNIALNCGPYISVVDATAIVNSVFITTGNILLYTGQIPTESLYTGYFYFDYTGNQIGETQFSTSGIQLANGIYLSVTGSEIIRVINNGPIIPTPELELELEPQNSGRTNHAINVKMKGINANRIKYYITNAQEINSYETCALNGTLLTSGTGETTINEEGTTYIYLCGGGSDGRTGLKAGIYQIDRTPPTFTLSESTVYECQDGTATITDASGGLSGLPENAYSWNGGAYESRTSYNAGTRSSTGTETVTVKVKDNAGNTETQSTTITWQNHELEQTSITKPLGEITTNQIRPNVTGDFGITAGSCEIITGNIVGMSDNVTCTPNGNELTITPYQNINGEEGYCEIEFTDGETTVTGRYTFSINTVISVDPLELTLNPTGSERTGNSISITMTAQNASGAKYLLTGASGLGFNTCRNASNGGILVSNSTTPTIYEGTTTINTNGINYLYLCAQSLTGQEEIISGVYKIDITAPTVTFNEQSGATAPSHSVTITVNDSPAGLQENQSIRYKWTTGECGEDGYSNIVLSPTATGTHTATATVTTEGLANGDYYLCIKSGSVYDQAGNTNTGAKTSGIFVIGSESIPMPSCIPTTDCFTGSSEIIVCTGDEGTIHFTTNGNNPTCSDEIWSDRSFDEDTTLKVIACNGGNQSQPRTYTYTKDTVAPNTIIIGVPSDRTGNNVTLTASTSTGNMGCNNTHTTYYCIYNSGEAACEPNTQVDTTIDIECESDNVCQKIVRYYSKDGIGNTETIQQTQAIKIDKKAPVCGTVEYNPPAGQWTNGNVTGTFTATDEGAGLSTQTPSPKELLFTDNQSRNVTFRDKVGNSVNCHGNVNRIDKTPATGTITLEYPSGNLENQCTSGNVILTLTGEDTNGLADAPYSRNGTTRTGNASITLTNNASGTGYIKDAAGNITEIPYNITGISHSGPSINLTAPSSGEAFTGYVEFEWNITATNPTCQEINGGYHIVIYSGGEEYYTGTTTSTNTGITLPDGDYTWKIYVIDILGHRADSDTLPFSVNQNAPICNIIYTPEEGVWTNGSVRAILTGCSEGATGFNQTGYEFEENGQFTFTFTNDNGISNIKVANVQWIDKIPPFVSGHTNTTTGWYTGDLQYSFIYNDTGAGIDGTNTISCTINTEGTGKTCSINDVNICDKAGNCNINPVVSQGINLDKSKPICGTWTYNPGSGTQTTGNVLVTLSGSYDTISQINVSTGSCTITGNNQNCNLTISDNAGNTQSCTSEKVTWIDKVAPVLHEVTPIGTTTDTTPNYIFSSTKSGTIAYSGACSSTTTGAVSGNNTITLNQLAYGTYSNCTITVTDAAGNTSNVLNISEFTIRSSGGGGGHGLKKDYCPDGDYSDSYYDRTCEGPIDICGISTSKFNTEMKTAYLYAYQHGMTTICPIDDADLYGFIRRDQLAKMLTQYAINVLDLKPQAGKSGCTAYNDIANSSAEMKYYMKTACELDIMGLESDGKTPMKSFYPHGLVSRAEFGTTLSRLIYGDAYNLESEAENTYPGAWYGKHLEALKRDEIMTQIYGDRPQHLELRGYVMLMLMRHGKARLDNVKNIPYSTPEEIMDIYNKNKALTCETSYYESEDDYGSGMLYVKDNKLRENLKIHNEGNISSLIKNNKLYVRGDAIGSGMGMVADAEATALEELKALLEDDAYSFKNCNEAVKNINAFEIPSNIRFKSIGDWFTELANSFTSIFE